MPYPQFFEHHSTAWLQPLADAMPDQAILAINRRGRCLAMNPLATSQLLGMHAQGTTPVLPDVLRKPIVAALQAGQPGCSMAVRLQGLSRRFYCRLIYPQRGRKAIGVVLSEEQRAASDQLKRMHHLVQTLVDMSPDMISIKDADNRWVLANQPMLDQFQLSAEDYQFQHNRELKDGLPTTYQQQLLQESHTDQHCWQVAQPYLAEEQHQREDGSTQCVLVHKQAIFDEDCQPSHLITVTRDLSTQKATSAALKQRSDILDTLISCDWMLHSAERWQMVADKVLQQCCLSLRFNRGQVLQHHWHQTRHKREMRSQCLHMWSAQPSAETASVWEKVSFLSPHLQRWYSLLSNGQPVLCDAKLLPPAERKMLRVEHAHTIVVVPLMIHQHWWGSLVIERDYVAAATTSQELGALSAIGRTLSVAIDREHTGRHLNMAKIAFDSTTEGIMIVNTSGDLIGINQGYTLITGFEENEVLGQKPQIFRHRPAGFLTALKRDGKWTGEIENFRKSGEKYTEWMTITAVKNHANMITNYVGVFADITEIKRSQQQLNALVNHDPLTGLPNRRLIQQLFSHALQHATRNASQAAVLFIDLDRFKNVNDSLGHYAGDQLLLDVTERIRGALRASDIVGRLGGDEFIILLENLHDKADAAHKAQDILHALKQEFGIDDHAVYVGASIGIAMYPEDGLEVESLIKAADLAMYQVKNNGKNHYAFYDASLSQYAVEHFQLENDLRQALVKQQLRVFYQPQIDLHTGLITGAEALIRWEHPVHGMIPPNKFIPLAEETGLVLSIGEWILAEAIRQARRWQQESPVFNKIAVNVSAVQIMKSQFADTVYGLLLENDCDPSLIELEITESTLMQHTDHVVNTFHQLKELGVRIAIDDFGTGYSSLSHLKRLPLDQLKIDRSFVKDLPDDKDDAAITNAIFAMATQLGFTVVAEGVETIEQEAFLQRLGCQSAQGFLYSFPVKAPDFGQLLTLNNQKRVICHA